MEIWTLAYMVGFLRTLLIIAIIYFAIRIFTRYILPLLINKGIKDMQQKMHNQHRQQQKNQRREGDVTVQYKNGEKQNGKHNQGEYIDFEEVD
jgi:hypothetical protein